MINENKTIAIIGLGYVGLPLAVEFGNKYQTIGFAINEARVKELKAGQDSTLEVEPKSLAASSHLSFTTFTYDLNEANIYIVTVPTPIDEHKRPDLTALEKSSETVGSTLRKGDIVVYESTLYPGATEEICVSILEKASGLRFNKDFFVGYSTERINPGDKEHRVTTIKKVTAGSTPETADTVDELYRSIVTAGAHKASGIKVAEAAKVIENTQRDVNIALINELAMIFNRLGIDTAEALKAAGSKWNFLPFRPGLVGGHCIGVDPHYLTHKAMEVGHHPGIILAGRRLNDNMGSYRMEQITRPVTQRRIHIGDSRLLILGLTFKENCPDLRNTRIVDIIDEFKALNTRVDVYDLWMDKTEAQHKYGTSLAESLENNRYDAIVLAVSHDEFKTMGIDAIHALGKEDHILYDVKHLYSAEQVDDRL